MSEHEVKIPARQARSYAIRIGSDILGSVWPQMDAEFPKRGKFVVTDRNLASAGHLDRLLGQRQVATFVIDPPGETSKHVNTVISIVEAMEKAYLGRDSLIVALGGGTVGDIAGFAAAIFKRGVPVVQIPTTTVAQADSAVGGKTGVDSSISKNAFGAFWHPAAVYIDVATLNTLDERQFRAGLVESVKHALIADSQYFDFLEDKLNDVLERKLDVLEELARYNCRIKGNVVEADPNEQNQRRMLNYGHTIGHAVEAASGFELLHGEAIAIGIIAAGMIEIELQLGRPDRLDRIRRILEKLGVPVKLPHNLAEDELIDLMKRDKKAVNKWPRFVLISEIGGVFCRQGQWAVEVDPDVVAKVLQKL
ncbi:MAG: 3-dehydroquinate synthase [Phycisphaerales bacterium]|nr:MAG: 3-dehydroquinate synthase [Phycisphaerales bacterium]